MEKKSNAMITEIKSCEAMDCVYNHQGDCTTIGITVGDGKEPCCDTYFKLPAKGGNKGTKAMVGACHVSVCAHNERYECSAGRITVTTAAGHPDCKTFTTRS